MDNRVIGWTVGGMFILIGISFIVRRHFAANNMRQTKEGRGATSTQMVLFGIGYIVTGGLLILLLNAPA